MFGKGRRKFTDKKPGRKPGFIPWNKGKTYKANKTYIFHLLLPIEFRKDINSKSTK